MSLFFQGLCKILSYSNYQCQMLYHLNSTVMSSFFQVIYRFSPVFIRTSDVPGLMRLKPQSCETLGQSLPIVYTKIRDFQLDSSLGRTAGGIERMRGRSACKSLFLVGRNRRKCLFYAGNFPTGKIAISPYFPCREINVSLYFSRRGIVVSPYFACGELL